MRKPIIAGNWKMNNTIAETKALVTELIPLVKDAKADVVICTPYTDLATAVEMTKGTNIHVGAENVHWAEKGAFTGEVSANMRGIRHHRTQRTPSVFRRDRSDRQRTR